MMWSGRSRYVARIDALEINVIVDGVGIASDRRAGFGPAAAAADMISEWRENEGARPARPAYIVEAHGCADHGGTRGEQ